MGGPKSIEPIRPEHTPEPTPPFVPGSIEQPAIKPAGGITIGKHRTPTAKEVTAGESIPESPGEITVAGVKENFDDIIGNILKKLDSGAMSIEEDAEAAESILKVSSESDTSVIKGIDEKFMTELAGKLAETDKDIKKAELDHLSALETVYSKAATVKGSLVSSIQEVVGPPQNIFLMGYFAASSLQKTLPLLEDGGLRDMLAFDWMLDRVTVDSAEGAAAGAFMVEKPLAAVELLLHGAVGTFLVFQALRLHAMKKQLNEIKKKHETVEDPKIEQQIKVLEKFLAAQDEILKSISTGYMVTTTAYVPKGYYFASWIADFVNFTISSPVVLAFGYLNALVRLPLQAYILRQSEKKWDGVKKGIKQVTDRLYADPTREEFNKFVVETLEKEEFSEIIDDFNKEGIDFKKLETSEKTIFGKISKTVEEPKTPQDIEEILSSKTLREDMFFLYGMKRLRGKYDGLIEGVFTGKTLEDAKRTFQETFGLNLEKELQILGFSEGEALPKNGDKTISNDVYTRFFTEKKVRTQFSKRVFPFYETKQNIEKLLAKRKDRFDTKVQQSKSGEFKTVIDSFRSDASMKVEDAKEKGLRFDRVTIAECLTPENKETLLNNPKVKDKLREQFLRTGFHKDIFKDPDIVSSILNELKGKGIGLTVYPGTALPSTEEFNNIGEIRARIKPEDLPNYESIIDEIYKASNGNKIDERKKAFDVHLAQALKEDDPAVYLEQESIFLGDRNLAEIGDTTIRELMNENAGPLNTALLQQYVRHKETITALRKSGLKSVFNKKVEIEKSFVKFDVTTRRVVFAITFVATALAFIAFAILGAVFPPLGIGLFFTYLSLVMTSMGVVVLIAGHAHLKHKKPNAAKVSNYLKRAKISVYKIPLAIRSWMLERRKAELIMNSSQTMVFYSAKLGEVDNILRGKEEFFEGAQLPGLEGVTNKKQIKERIDGLRKEAEKKFNELSKKSEQINKKIESWNNKINSVEARIKFHRDVLDAEGFKDFAKTSRLEGDKLDLTSTIVDAFLDPDFHADLEMIDFFHTAGFDLSEIRSKVAEGKQKPEKLQEEVKTKVLALFGAMTDDLMGKISTNEAQFNLLKRACAASAEGGD